MIRKIDHLGFGKTDSVLRFKKPKDCNEVRSFLGLVNYMGRFIPNLADLSGPLHRENGYGENKHMLTIT